MDTHVIVAHGVFECANCLAVDLTEDHFTDDGVCRLTLPAIPHTIKVVDRNWSEAMSVLDKYQPCDPTYAEPSTVNHLETDDCAKRAFLVEIAVSRNAAKVSDADLALAAGYICRVYGERANKKQRAVITAHESRVEWKLEKSGK